MDLSLFDFTLPEARIALHPVTPRDAARMLHVTGQGTCIDRTVRQLPDLLRPHDVLVINNTQVMPAQLHGTRGQAKIDITLHQPCEIEEDAWPSSFNPEQSHAWRAFVRPARKLRVGDLVHCAGDLELLVLATHGQGEITLGVPKTKEAFLEWMDQYGQMPLPPYIARKRGVQAKDHTQYQTMFATRPGAVAAPTAGLHFTPELLHQITEIGVTLCQVTLHVGAGTFLPVKTQDVTKHRMHSEWCELPEEVARTLHQAKAKGGRVIAVGTTALRTLEAASKQGTLQAFQGNTDIFITPGYRFQTVDVLLTNFHLPRSTLFMLVSAFCGREEMLRAYQHAIEAQYRFYSYGDACFLERATP